jgi:hypothetical protein
MLAQVKKLVGGAAGGDFAGRFGAWWNGKDYVPPPPAEEGAADSKSDGADAKPPKKAKPDEKPPEPVAATDAKTEPQPEAKPEEPKAGAPKAETPIPQSADAQAIRIQALETLWGEGRLAPGSGDLDNQLLDAVLELAEQPGPIGFIGADSALLSAFASRSDRLAIVAEWRAACVARTQALAPQAVVAASDVDRPTCFGEKSLEGLVSIEAFAYADHKAGLVGRAQRALSDNGRWVFLDTTRNTNKTPPQAFASAWAEPQLATVDEIEELLQLAGFPSVRKIAATELVLNAARAGYAHLSTLLENAASNGLGGREGALFLQELAWEAQSWRARIRALEGGALEVNLWIADKTAALELTETAIPEDVLDLAVTPDDAGASGALFDKA